MSKSEYEELQRQALIASGSLGQVQREKAELEHKSNSWQQLEQVHDQAISATSQIPQLKKQISSMESQLAAVQNVHHSELNHVSHLQKQQAEAQQQLKIQQNLFSDVLSILETYGKSKGLKLNTTKLLTEILPAEAIEQSKILRDACIAKYIEGFDAALAKVTNIDFQDSDGRTILMHAINNGFYYGVDKLLQRGVDVNLLDSQGANALLYCARLAHIKYIKIIAEKTLSDKINLQTKYGDNNALHFLIANASKVVFTSELNGELRGLNIQSSFIITDEDYAMAGNYGRLIVGNGSLTTTGNITFGLIPNTNQPMSYEKSLRIISHLVAKGANIDAQNEHLLTPFFLACNYQHRYLAHKLLDDYPINLNLKDKFGNSALHWSLVTKDITLVDKLLAKGMDVNQKDAELCTVLFIAAKNQLFDIVDLLFNSHSAQDAPNNTGLTVWDLATFNFHQRLINILAPQKKVNPEFIKLWCAAKTGDQVIVEQQIKKGIYLDCTIGNRGETTPLMAAVVANHLAVVATLAKAGADVNKVTNDGDRPLYHAAGNNNVLMAQLLIDNNADANIPANDGSYPWHLADIRGFLDIIKILAPKIPNIDYKTANANKYTALWLAAQEGHLETVKWLISNHADVNASRESDGRTALQAAILGKKLPVVQELVEHGADINKANNAQFTPIYHAVEIEDLKTIKFLLEHGANSNLASSSGDKPIHLASMLCNIIIMKILLERGATICDTNNSGNTPLHEVLLEENTAEPSKKIAAVKYLMAKSAKVDIKNAKEETALDLADHHFKEALPWLVHPETLPPLAELEASLIGNFSYAEI